MFDAEIKNPLQLLRGDKQDNAIFGVERNEKEEKIVGERLFKIVLSILIIIPR